MIAANTLLLIAPSAVQATEIAKYISNHATSYGVDTVSRMVDFLAETAQETDGYQTLEEYASGSAYEGRTDLGNTQPGDGKRFKGRGLMMTTGRYNYTQLSQHLFGDTRLLKTPELLLKPEYAVKAALYYWQSKNLNRYSDANDFEGLTRAINGGLTGIKTRLLYRSRAQSVIKKKL